jgi:ubiquinone/menaquinone biosynthesis C-methylase UbiE
MGGGAWNQQLNYALTNFTGIELEGQSILDIGTRSGKIASLFALLGGTVTGIDIQPTFLEIANAEIQKLGVSNQVNFVVYDGDLDLFPDQSFDIIFTKSVLVVVPDLENFLHKISDKLKPNGKVVFLENAKGGLLHFLRRIKHQKWDYSQARFWTSQEVNLVYDILSLVEVRQSYFPPTYLVLGQKKSSF